MPPRILAEVSPLKKSAAWKLPEENMPRDGLEGGVLGAVAGTGAVVTAVATPPTGPARRENPAMAVSGLASPPALSTFPLLPPKLRLNFWSS
ncbi:hypothetical protein RBB78_25135 (plasmid) [Tunturiibacter empetritectus]|uniref:hypothetical protein n=1 Tax=Tunturiibacter empetritectus TaxID=3069691 RepID=UPI003D9AD502